MTEQEGAIYAEFTKVDADRREVFGWASITDQSGLPVIDLQGDVLPVSELEKAAYDYVLDSRVGGAMHERGKVTKDFGPKQVGTLIESFVVTPEKVEKMGLPEGSLPNGWWIGFKVSDEEVWKGVKDGKFTGFSIHGVGKRSPLLKKQVGKSSDSLREQLLQQAFAHAKDEISFAKNVAEIADVLLEREHPEAAYFGEVVKHLIGRHEQKDHDPTQGTTTGQTRQRHKRSEHPSQAGHKTPAALGGVVGGLGGALAAARASGGPGAMPWGAVIGGGLGVTLGGASTPTIANIRRHVDRRFPEGHPQREQALAQLQEIERQMKKRQVGKASPDPSGVHVSRTLNDDEEEEEERKKRLTKREMKTLARYLT